jgi:hypothetical protein
MGSIETPGDREVAAFLAEMRAAYVSDPEEAVASRHLAAIAREAELVQLQSTPKPAAWRRVMNRNRFLRPVVTLGAATLVVVLGTAGLAVAGVNLPDPADEAFEKVGISLPNQAGGGERGEHSRSDEVRSVIEATPPSERGCEFGHRVAEAARGSALPENAQGACDRANESRRGKGAQRTNSNRSQFGRDTADKAQGLGGATVDERRSFGEDTAGQAEELGGAPDQAPAAEQRPESAPRDGTIAAPEGTPDGAPDAAPTPDAAPIPDGTPTGPPDGTPGGRP